MKKLKKTTLWMTLAGILAVLLVLSIFTQGFKFNKAGTSAELKGKAIILNDARCTNCDVSSLVESLSQAVPGLEFVELDYQTKQGKEIYEKNELTALPAILFTDSIKENAGYSNVERYLEEKGDYLSLRIGTAFDPNAEICDNEKDDTGDGLVDCADPSCSTEWKCMPKKDKVDVDLFVMSQCPYGTQMEKGILPAAKLLGDKVNFNIRFVYYAMHGKTEIDEQMLQYCIQKDFKTKYADYLECFLEDGNSGRCLTKTSLTGKLDSCIAQTDSQFKVTANFNDNTKWIGSFPPFDIDKALNEQYGVSGSPTLVINGVVAETGRDSASLLNAICTGFSTQPAECSQTLSSAAPSPGFGSGTATTSTSGSCG